MKPIKNKAKIKNYKKLKRIGQSAKLISRLINTANKIKMMMKIV